MSPALRTSKISLIDLCVNFLNYKFGHVAEEMKTALQVACTPTKGSKRKRVAILVEKSDTVTQTATTLVTHLSLKKTKQPNNSKRETSAFTFHSKARLWLSSTTEISMLGRYYKSITQTLLSLS